MLDGGVTGLEDTCFVGVYQLPTTSSQSNIYYFGSPFFHEYYVSFSLESWERNFGDYLQVGIGPICKTAHLGDIVYNKDYAHYNPNLHSNDTSASTGKDVIYAQNLVNECIPPVPDKEDTAPESGGATEPPTKSSNTMLAVALSVGGAALILTIVIISIYCYRKAAQKQTFNSVADNKNLLDFKGKSSVNPDHSMSSRADSTPQEV